MQAEEKGLLVPHSGDTVYEGTVGSTGISLAAICRARGYKAHMCVNHLIEEVKRTNYQQLHARRYGNRKVRSALETRR